MRRRVIENAEGWFEGDPDLRVGMTDGGCYSLFIMSSGFNILAHIKLVPKGVESILVLATIATAPNGLDSRLARTYNLRRVCGEAGPELCSAQPAVFHTFLGLQRPKNMNKPINVKS